MENREKRRRNWNRGLGILLLSAAAAVMCWQLYLIYAAGMRHVLHGLLLVFGVCVPLFFGALLLARSFTQMEARARTVRAVLFTLFGFYCAAIFGALIVSRVDYANFAETSARYREEFDRMTNFVPLETVRLYLNAIKYNYIGMEIPLSNLVGNVMLFMPMGLFLPCLFRPMRKFWLFTLTMLLGLLAIEALQLLLACGSCDVDDVLLNLAGTLVVFGVLKIPAVRRLLARLYLLSGDGPAAATAESSASQPR